MLTELIYYLDVLLDQEDEGRHRAERAQNSEVPYIQYSIGGARRKFDYINYVVERFRLRSTMDVDTLSPSLLCISMDRSLRVRRFFCFHAMIPNRKVVFACKTFGRDAVVGSAMTSLAFLIQQGVEEVDEFSTTAW